jgi:acyl-CoA reductase-like NAD-dependent aldehyde dehydrogenase
VSEVERAIAGAAAAFPKTSELASEERARVLRAVRDAVERRAGLYVEAIVTEARKPVRFARAEVERCLVTLRVASEEATRIGGEVLPVDIQTRARGAWCIVERFPKGTVSALTPFNFPLNLVAHKVAPALACGCPVIVKPSPRTPRAAELLVEDVVASGWPEGGCSLVECGNDEASPLWTDERIAVVSFTGSDSVGWRIRAQAGRKTVVLELGGNAGVIVHSDADLADAAEKLALSSFAYAGQVCIKAQRLFVEARVFDRFVELFIAASNRLPTGDPADDGTVVAPMIDEAAADRVWDWVEEARRDGARVLLEGTRDGTQLTPTILAGVPAGAKVREREVFGPVATVEPYTEFDEAIARVNDSEYGLQAAIFTRDIGRIRRAFRQLRVGGVIVNDSPSTRIDNYPYGGVKASGFGREGIRSAIAEYTEPRVLFVRG